MAAAHAQPHVRQDVKAIPSARKAEKRQVKLKLGIQGPSGSGKTEGALALATNLWPDAKILVVDTENESASLYAFEMNRMFARRKRREHHPISVRHSGSVRTGRLRTRKSEQRQ